jgi:membrane-associated protease RseP (regulator of RpoE activity)
MLKRLSILCLVLLAAAPLFAAQGDGDEGGERRTIVVRDGKVLIDDGEALGVKRAYIGVAMVDLTPELREFFGAPKDAGVLVSSLTDNGPAAKAGLRVGDVITAVNGKPVESMREVVSAMRDKHAGDAIRIDTVRGKAKQSIVATAEERDLSDRIREFKLPMLENMKGTVLPRGEWKAFVNSPDTDELRARIRELENRLQDLEKKLQK